jgi:Fe2+ or Zn2+ uptake regulation protein
MARLTKQKKELAATIEKFNSFFDAQDVAKASSLPLATIYRYLKDQVAQGELFSYRCDGKSIYSTKKRSHCHFVCEKTGKIIHFDIGNLDVLKKAIPGTIESFQIEVRGVCNDSCCDECHH